jgi:cellobiose phosphorylase
MFIVIGADYVEICRRTGKEADARDSENAIAAMRRSVIAHGWDGEWFVRAYDDAGRKVGSRECEDGKIFIESNAFCAIAEVGAESGMPVRALDSVRRYLDTPYGIVILDPPYAGYHLELGEISSYPPSYKENGGVFCHNNPWIMIAECIAGRPARAFEYYRKISPAYLDGIQELHRMEPYVYSQMIAGKAAARPGEAKNSWLTGTAAWNYVAISQWILGVRPDFDGLRIQPCLPAELTNVQITRLFRGTTYRISIRNTGKPAAEQRIRVNGKPAASCVVPPGKPGSDLAVEVDA